MRCPPFPAGLSAGFAGGEKPFSPPACCAQGPGGSAFSFEDILDMGTSSLSTWDLAKSQADPHASSLAQLEPWLTLPCLLPIRVLATCKVALSAAGCPNPSPLFGHIWHLLACSWENLWAWLSFRRSFPLCVLLADVLAFILTTRGGVTRIPWLPGLQPARARCPCSSTPSADRRCSLLAVTRDRPQARRDSSDHHRREPGPEV